MKYPHERTLTERCWSLGSDAARPDAPFLRLLPGGRISGHRSERDTLWEMQDGIVLLLDEAGQVTSRFETVEADDAGLIRLATTPSAADPNRRVLHEIAPHHDAIRPHLPAAVRRQRPVGRRRNLVVIRANERSLHPAWTRDIEDNDRNWDLCTSFYGRPGSFPPADDAEYAAFQDKEHKFHAIRSLLLSEPRLLNYDYFMFPDDDIDMSWRDINRMFHACRMWDLEIAQPSMHHDGIINFDCLKQDPRYRVRFVNMVEIMIPILSRRALDICLPTFDVSRSAFGISYIWSKIVDTRPEQVAIIDDVAIMHTRPTGSSYNHAAAMLEGADVSSRYGTGGFYDIKVLGGLYR